MRYCPEPSLMAVRTFSMRAGLEASTVTPGRTAPDGSLMTPLMVACAQATWGASQTTVMTTATRKAARISHQLAPRGSNMTPPDGTVLTGLGRLGRGRQWTAR